MFNLKSQKTEDESDLLKHEMGKFNIVPSRGGNYLVDVGDQTLDCNSLKEAQNQIFQGIEEIREHLWDSWKDLAHLSEHISSEQGQNSGSLNNLLFLNAAKKAFSMSLFFTDLDFAGEKLLDLLDTDIKSADNYLVKQFNLEYLKIRSMHRLIMSEIYRHHIISQYLKITKQAQISGPWANLDLPMEERKWEWDSTEDEYFEDRQRSRREQTRYNPENATTSGFYYVWQDYTRDPYRFTDMQEDSPYKSRTQLLIP